VCVYVCACVRIHVCAYSEVCRVVVDVKPSLLHGFLEIIRYSLILASLFMDPFPLASLLFALL
jgi:hypothetical protein